MTNTESPADRNQSIDELDRAIVSLSAHINVASHDLLILIRRFDERGTAPTGCTGVAISL